MEVDQQLNRSAILQRCDSISGRCSHHSDDLFGGISEVALYPFVTFHPLAGDISLGVPHPAIDSYIRTPSPAGSRVSALGGGAILSGSVLPGAYLGTYLPLPQFDTPLGVRNDGSFANGVDLGVSYHRVGNLNLNVLNIAVTYNIGNVGPFGGVTLVGAVEAFSDGAPSTDFFLGVDANVGNGFTTGLLYASIEAPIAFADFEVLHAYLSFSPLAGLKLTGQIMTSLAGGNSTAFSVDAKYNFFQGVYGEIGYGDSDTTDGVLNVALGVRF